MSDGKCNVWLSYNHFIPHWKSFGRNNWRTECRVDLIMGAKREWKFFLISNNQCKNYIEFWIFLVVFYELNADTNKLCGGTSPASTLFQSTRWLDQTSGSPFSGLALFPSSLLKTWTTPGRLFDQPSLPIWIPSPATSSPLGWEHLIDLLSSTPSPGTSMTAALQVSLDHQTLLKGGTTGFGALYSVRIPQSGTSSLHWSWSRDSPTRR